MAIKRAKRSTPAHARRNPVNPRIKDRKIAVARAAGKRRLFGIFAVLALIGTGVGAIALLHSSVFSARHIVITGAAHTTQVSVIAITHLDTNPPLIDVNPANDAQLIRKLPWVKHATVSRDWPSTVHIAITERTPIGEITLSGGHFAIVDATGHVLEDVVGPIPHVLHLIDIANAPAPGGVLSAHTNAIVQTAAATPVSIVTRIAYIGANPKDGVVLGLKNGPIVIFANDEDLRQKMVSLATVLAPSSKVALSGIATIDLRVPSSPVLTR